MSESQPPSQSPQTLDYQTPAGTSARWRTVWTARNPTEANLAVAQLQELGLHARVDMEASATLGPWAGVTGGTNVQAIEGDVAAARTVLLEIDQRRERRQRAMVPACPRCGATESKRAISDIRRAGVGCIVAGTMLLIVPIPQVSMSGFALMALSLILMLWPLTARWRCPACGHRWIAPDPELAEDGDEDKD